VLAEDGVRPPRFDMATMASYRERAFWHPHFARQEHSRREERGRAYEAAEGWPGSHY
jgi:hypothetical protein